MTDQPTAGEPADAAETAAADLAAVMRLAADGPYGAAIASETSRRRLLYDLLANSADPLWKEIGTQLRDGQMQVRDVFEVDEYNTHLIDAIDKHSRDFPAALARTREDLEADRRAR
jgi:hypothetical protein